MHLSVENYFNSVYNYCSLQFYTSTWESQYTLSAFRCVQDAVWGQGPLESLCYIFKTLGTDWLVFAHRVQLWAWDTALGYGITLLCGSSKGSSGGMQKQYLLISECKMEEMLSCHERNSLWNVLVLNCRFPLVFITLSRCFRSMHSESSCLSLFSPFLWSNYENWF